MLWNSVNKLQFLGNKKYWNFLRNIYYWFRNIKALKIINENFESEILNLIEKPNKEEWIWIIFRIYKCKVFYQKEINDEIGNEFVCILEDIFSKRLSFENPCKALDYCLGPLKNIYFYLYQLKINNKNENPEIEVIAENIIHELNLIEEKTEVSYIELLKFNKMLYNSLFENDKSTKKVIKNISIRLNFFLLITSLKILINNCTNLNDNSKNFKEKNETRKLDLSLNYHPENQTFHA